MEVTGGNSGDSGYLENDFEPVSSQFSGIEILEQNEVNVLARGVRYGRRYMLKSLTPAVAGQQMYRQMLVKEFDILMRLNHPGVLQAVQMCLVEPLGECIVTEWIDGVTLDRWLEQHGDSASRRRIAAQLLQAVSHIHDMGIAHRDLKPENVMVTHNGESVKIIDFGLADTDDHTTLKQPGGTQGYMSPEQLTTRSADVRNDIYSLGVMLLDMNLGGATARQAKRCLKPIDERPQSVEPLLEALQRDQQRGKRIAIAAATVLAAALLSLTAYIAARSAHLEDDNTRLRNELAQRDTSQTAKAEQLQVVEKLRDSIHDIARDNDVLQQTQRATDEHRERITAASERGKQLVDRAMLQTHVMEHLDTLSSTQYLSKDYAGWCNVGLRAINEYVGGLDEHFGEDDKAAIYNMLVKYNADKWLAEINRKMEKITNAK